MSFKRILCLLTLLCLVATALPGPGSSAKAETNYTITVDVTNQIVTVYDTGNISDSGIVRQMICSTGKNATPTPLGTYSLPKPHSIERKEWYYFSEFNCYAKWATRVVRGILFHSVLYTAKKKGPTSASTKALGSKASHGCIRLKVEDAYWIAMNCPEGTTCKIFKGTKNEALRKKVKSKTFSRDEMTYEQFAGSATAAAGVNLSKGKKGQQVTELQNRLRALGYMSAAADGKFGNSTRDAVNAFRAACGLKKTGKVDQALWDRIFADDAPTSTLATLVKGWQGPAVKVLQQALSDLKLYSGAVDGSFGADTREAVQNYQSCFNLTVNGAADTALQNDAIARAQNVKAQFGDAAYQMVTSTADVTLATMNVKSYTRMRATPSTKGKKLVKLLKSTRVKVLSDDGGDWVQIQAGGVTGYVQRKYLNMYAGTETAVSYEAVTEATPETTPLPEVFIPASEPETAVAAPELAAPELVAEPLPAVALAAPEGEQEVALAELLVDAATEAPAEAEAPAEIQPLPHWAVTLVDGAPLYAQPAEEAAVVAQLPANAALPVEGIDGAWIVVRYEQGVAYLRAADVTLTDDAPAAPEEAPAPEVGEATDAAPAPEVGEATDAAPAPEVSEATDAAPAPEASEATDAASAPEAGEATDGAPVPEAGEAIDAAPVPEASEATDAASAPEAGEATDGAPVPEVGEAIDAPASETGMEPDVEPALEMGTEPVVEAEPANAGEDGTGLIFEDEAA